MNNCSQTIKEETNRPGDYEKNCYYVEELNQSN